MATLNTSTPTNWENVRSATYVLNQKLVYTYQSPITDLRQRLTIIPPANHLDQQRLSTNFSVSPDDGVIRSSGDDPFGNYRLLLKIPRVERSIVFRSKTTLLRSSQHQFPPADFSPYVKPTRLTQATPELKSMARFLLGQDLDDQALAAQINQWVHQRLAYKFGTTSVHTTAAEALAGGSGLCQDFTHVFLALARLCDLPSRYVSGHLLGPGGSHAWVEVLLDSNTSVPRVQAYDPTNQCEAGWNYLTVAVGRDYLDIVPTSGQYLGAAKSHLEVRKTLSISVDHLPAPRAGFIL